MRTVTETVSTSRSATYSCELTALKVDESEDMRYTTYGVAVLGAAGQQLLSYPDISTDKQFVEEFLNLIKNHDIALMHIPDLLEDYMD